MSLNIYLALARFHLAQLGATSIADLKDWQELEGRPPAGDQTVFFTRAMERATGASPEFIQRLPDYDRRLRAYEERLSGRRRDFAGFKYFQYLTLLFTEHHLDRLTSDSEAYLVALNRFLREGQERGQLDPGLTLFALPELRRLAFYLATGAGKTILLHVHYWQVQHYIRYGERPEALLPKGHPPDNVLLLVPNAGLANQHLSELERSGIPAKQLTEIKHNPASVLPGTVLVVDMPKLRDELAKDETEAEGFYYPMLGRANLVFVDEGHKGTRNADGAWRGIREYLSDEGLLLEYSATYAQVLSTPDHRRDYGKRILADYQYRYFYMDDYGKDFEPINVDPGPLRNTEFEEAALVGGLLLYYRQLELYLREADRLRSYNLEKPLWTFVGHTVTRMAKGQLGEIDEETPTLTDVAKVVRFVKRVLEEPGWAQELIHRAIHANEFVGSANPFARYLQVFQGRDPAELYARIREDVFGGEGALELHLLPARGEIGLRVSATKTGRYFGLISIGDTVRFKKIIEQELGLQVGENPLFTEIDQTGGIHERSLFREIDQPHSQVNLLIGSRRFIEGWSSWRVSTMTLLYIGRGEGPQIIQLFGRGVRLLGRDRSLKRSKEEWLRPLETLYILGLQADYVRVFLESIQKEALYERLEFRLDHHKDALQKRLPLPRLPQDFNFDRLIVRLQVTKEYAPTVILAPKVEVAEQVGERQLVTFQGGQNRPFTVRELQLLDWRKIMVRLREYARNRGYANLHVKVDELKKVFLEGHYRLVAFDEDLKDAKSIETAALVVLRRYLDRFYRAKLNEAQTQAMRPDAIYEEELPRAYVVTVPHDSTFLEQLKALQADLKQWRMSAPTPLPRLYLDPAIAALYHPLVYETKACRLPHGVRVSPVPLQESEYDFVKELEDFWKICHKNNQDMYLYLMRNPSKTGLGFHHGIGFYPDFILWVERAGRWRVVFVEPHGMRNETLDDNPKLEIFTDLLPRLNTRLEFKQAHVELDGYILTQTPPSEIPGASEYKSDWDRMARERHVLVKERGTEANLKTICGL